MKIDWLWNTAPFEWYWHPRNKGDMLVEHIAFDFLRKDYTPMLLGVYQN